MLFFSSNSSSGWGNASPNDAIHEVVDLPLLPPPLPPKPGPGGSPAIYPPVRQASPPPPLPPRKDQATAGMYLNLGAFSETGWLMGNGSSSLFSDI